MSTWIILVGCLTAQCALTYTARCFSRRWLSLTVMFCVLWTIYYGIRGIAIFYFPGIHNHPAVSDAGDAGLRNASLWSTVGLGCFVGGAWLLSHMRARNRLSPSIRRSTLLFVCVCALCIKSLDLIFSLQSGVFTAVGDLSLFAIAALFAMDSGARIHRLSLLLLGAALAIGIASSFKEAAVLPVIAATIGRLGPAQRHVRPQTVVAIAALVVFGYFTVAGLRISTAQDDNATAFTAAYRALTAYDLESGDAYRSSSGIGDSLTGVLLSISRRFGGMDSFMVVDNYLAAGGQRLGWVSITDPFLSLFPFTAPDSRFSQLSSGRFFAVNFWSARPSTDPSAQSITLLGDLNLALGPNGIVIGIALFGVIVGFTDLKLKPTTPFAAGAFVYVGLPLMGLERNLTYVLGSTALRAITLWVVVLVLLTVAKRDGLATDGAGGLQRAQIAGASRAIGE